MTQADPAPGKKLAKQAITKVLHALNRADEIGGEVRDYIQERVLRDERYVRLRRKVASWRGEAYASAAEHDARAAAVATAAAAAAPTAAASAKKGERSLGDPAIKAQIYGKKSCPWTGRAMTVLEKNKVDYDFLDLEEAEHEALQVRLSAETKQHTVPYVYLRGQFIGGYNALAEVERLGQLDVALMTAEERAAAPAHLRSVVITPRPNTDEVAPADSAPAAE
jgi:glutaredoxin 3